MTDLLNRANVDIAINTLLDDLQPNDSIQPSDHNGLLKDILDTLSNGLSTVLRTGNTTDGQNLTITSSSIFQFENGSNGRLQSDSLTAFRNWTLPDKNGTVAMLSDITGGDNISSANLTFDGSYYADLNSNEWSIKEGSNSYFNIKSTGEFVIGKNAQNLSTSSQKYKNTIIGYDAETTAVNVYGTVSIGLNATTSNNFAVAIGNNAISSGASSISILGTATKSDSIAIGKNTNATGNFRSICLGANSSATFNQAVAIGSTAQATGNFAQAFGTGANATQTSALAVGYLAKASAIQGIAIGINTESVLNHNNSIVIGSGVSNTAGNRLSSTATNQFVVGFDSINPTILIGATTDSYIKSTGNLSLETNTTVKGSDNSASTSGFKVTDVNNNNLLEVKNNGNIINEIISSSTDENSLNNYGLILRNLDSTNDNMQGITFQDNSASQQIRIFSRFGTKNSLNFDIRNTSSSAFENAFNYNDNVLNIFNDLPGNVNGSESLTIEGQHLSTSVGSGARIGFKQTGTNTYAGYIKSYTFGAGNTGLGFATGFGTNPTVNMSIDGNGIVNMANLPTSSAGLSSGDIWNNSGVLNIV